VQLYDINTKEVLGECGNVTYNKYNIVPYNTVSYKLKTSGIGDRTVALQLIISENFKANCFAGDIKADNEILAKSNYQEILLNEKFTIKDYALEQNYPNPFNPSTKIKFQLPKDGFVTLKVYDILGKEIATLINEEKSQGKYEVNFNASSLSSGVYIYKIQAGDFVSSRKMILLK
jgi:hypothetical protein